MRQYTWLIGRAQFSMFSVWYQDAADNADNKLIMRIKTEIRHKNLGSMCVSILEANEHTGVFSFSIVIIKN